MTDITSCLLKDTSLPLYHYSGKPLSSVSDLRHREQDVALKPRGLWVSYDEDQCGWADWCRSEGFRKWRLAQKTRVNLSKEAKLFHLPSLETREGIARLSTLTEIIAYQFAGMYDVVFNWGALAELCDGFIVTGYSYAARLDGPLWYNAMDCDCACIWNPEIIESLDLVSPLVILKDDGE